RDALNDRKTFGVGPMQIFQQEDERPNVSSAGYDRDQRAEEDSPRLLGRIVGWGRNVGKGLAQGGHQAGDFRRVVAQKLAEVGGRRRLRQRRFDHFEEWEEAWRVLALVASAGD